MGFRPDQVVVAPSRRLRLLLLIAHLLALAGLWFSAAPVAAALPATLLLGVSAWRMDRRYGRLQGAGAIKAIRWDAERLWLQRRNDGWQEVSPSRASTIFSQAMFLQLTADGDSCIRLLLLPDSIGEQGYRRLQVELGYRISSPSPQS